jgi:hypothetical protein
VSYWLLFVLWAAGMLQWEVAEEVKDEPAAWFGVLLATASLLPCIFRVISP